MRGACWALGALPRLASFSVKRATERRIDLEPAASRAPSSSHSLALHGRNAVVVIFSRLVRSACFYYFIKNILFFV
jgi:hypothetical protein